MRVFARFGLILIVACALLLPAPARAQDSPLAWFEVDTLNPGLGTPPDINRDSPRAAVETLMGLLGARDYEGAAHLLDLSDLSPGEQGFHGPDLARKLGVVIERQVVIPWNDLTDRPDGWIAGADKEPGTGRVRRSILVSLLELDDHPVPLRLNRVKPQADDPVWIIARQSVRDIPLLYDRFQPTRLERAMPDWARKEGPFGMYVWEWLLLPVIGLVALVAGWLAYHVVSRLGRISDRRFVQSIVRAFRWPATIIVVAMILGLATSRLLVVTGPVSLVVKPLVLLLYVTAIALAAVLVADEVFDRVSLNSPKDLADPDNASYRSLATLISGIRKFVIIVAVMVGAGTLLSSIEVFNSLGYTLLAGAGAITIVLGFAAREVLGNILAAVQIALNRSARIGDLIVFEGNFCTVERIHFTYVQLLIWTGTRYIVPVSDFVTEKFENISASEERMVRPIEMTFAQSADVAALRDAFDRVVARIDDGSLAPDCAVTRVIAQDVFGKTVRFELPTTNQATFWELECRAREELLAEAARIEEETGHPILPQGPQRDLPDG
ncbi:mechanosensitive ion channel family protein [Lutimaribacter marinistellae]|uniref:Mechanosensitive ion channel family protein n=1 Tax=Lutimaribacter marinistellae TaxID=1820329 RepID=A0ABV7TND1_9RHOB